MARGVSKTSRVVRNQGSHTRKCLHPKGPWSWSQPYGCCDNMHAAAGMVFNRLRNSKVKGKPCGSRMQDQISESWCCSGLSRHDTADAVVESSVGR